MSRGRSGGGVVVVTGAILLGLLGACSDDRGAGAPASPPAATGPSTTAPPVHAMAPTAVCLEMSGATVGKVLPRDERLRALGDLAQTNSVEATIDDGLVGMAFAASPADAELLAELLRVPDDPYRIVTKDNVVLMYEPAAEPALRKSVDCLRP